MKMRWAWAKNGLCMCGEGDVSELLEMRERAQIELWGGGDSTLELLAKVAHTLDCLHHKTDIVAHKLTQLI